MIKKLLVIGYLVLITNYASGQLPTQLAPLISHEKIPLLFQFLPTQKTIQVCALTQSWLNVSNDLRQRATKSINLVSSSVLCQIKAGAFKVLPGGICACVLDAKGRIQEYDTHFAHLHYFQQFLVEVRFGQTTSQVSLPPIQKNFVQAKGVAYAKK